MFSYYGGKSKVVKSYPKPKYNVIIEPFAGSARYSLEYYDKNVILLDKYETIIRIWKFLQNASPDSILSLPDMKPGENTDNYEFPCLEAKHLMGFMVQQGVNAPRKTVSKVFGGGAMDKVIKADKNRIASNLFKIRHWDIRYGDYRDLENIEATWFIDPPYQFGGEYYHSKVNSKHINYKELADWCLSRKGQIIVCENSKANWLPFVPLKEMMGQKYKTTESIYTNT